MGAAGRRIPDDDVIDVPTHLDGLACDNAITYPDWSHPAFLDLCDRHRISGPGDWVLGVVNGCFDAFHLGHLNLLAQAAEWPCLGRTIFLVALLNSDASVARLKGPTRPLVPLAARTWIVAMQRGVQAAAGFSSDTPEAALARIRPDVLFKGDEYRGRTVVGAEHCGEVVYFPTTPGFSTSAMERKILSAGRSAPPTDGP